MANEEQDRQGEDRDNRGPRGGAGNARPAHTGKSKGYTRPSRDEASRRPRASDPSASRSYDERSAGSERSQDSRAARVSNTKPARTQDSRPVSSAQGRPSGNDRTRSESSRPLNSSSRPTATTSGDSRPYQGRPDRAGSDRGAPRRDSNSRPQGAYRGKGTPQREDEDRAPRNEGLVRKAPIAPDVPDEVTFDLLDKAARARLRTLSKDNAEDVGRHLVMAGRLLDIDPERAYQHAQVAVARGGRVDIVREAAALTAYASGRYADALREFRTVRRLNGSSEHLPLMADCERGLGRPERAIALAQEPEAKKLDPDIAVELNIVIAGARMDMGNAQAALLTLNRITTTNKDANTRIAAAKIDVLRALGRDTEADTLTAKQPTPQAQEPTWADEIFLYDTEELPDPNNTPPPNEDPETPENTRD